MDGLELSVIKRNERRLGKGGKMIRWGPKVSTGVKDKTPQGIASDNFKRDLKALGLDAGSVSFFTDEVSRMEQTRFMYMKVLAATYAMMKKYNITQETLLASSDLFDNDVIMEFIKPLMVTKTGVAKVEDDELTLSSKIVSFKQEMLRYMIAIFDHRSNANLGYDSVYTNTQQVQNVDVEGDQFDREDEHLDEDEVVDNVYEIAETY